MIDSQHYTINLVSFLVAKNKFYTKYNLLLNERQLKIIARLFEAGFEGFEGGLSAKNYQIIAKTSPATATRDLQELINLKIMIKTGDLKSSRYFLNLENLQLILL